MNRRNKAATVAYAGCLVAGLLSYLVISTADHRDQQAQDQRYCEMVELWDDNKHLPKEQRPGWPPYKGECHED